MNNDLIKRYIYAATRHLPQKMRGDVEKELESLISDMLDERCGDNPPADKDIKIVLLELGTPDELAAKYSGDEQKSLISGVYYIAYKRILKIVLPIIAAAIAMGMIISVLSDPSENSVMLIFQLFGQTLGGTIGGIWQAFAVITLIFAVLERTKTEISGDDTFSSLPAVPKQVKRIKPYEPIIGIFFSIAFAVLFLGIPQIISVRIKGDWIPVFNVNVLRGLWLPLILWAVLGIVTQSVKLIDGKNTKRLAVVTVVSNLIIIVNAAIVFLNKSIINPVFMELLNSGEEIKGLNNKLSPNFQIIFFVVICLAVIIESVTVIVNTWKYTKELKSE